MSPSCENFITLISIWHILSLKEHKTFANQKNKAKSSRKPTTCSRKKLNYLSRDPKII